MSAASAPASLRPGGAARNRFEQLTALRFFAALLVVISHAAMMPDSANALSWFGEHIIDYGHGRVGFFFMLSGFVLCHAYEGRLLERALDYRAFVIRRFLRIWPLHILIAAPLAAWMLWRDGSGGLPIVAANFLLLQSWFPAYEYYSSLNAPSWSLSTELFLYLVFPMLIALPAKLLRSVCVLLVVSSFVAPATLALAGHGNVMNGNGEVGFGYWFTAINPLIRLTEFTIGIVLCRLLRSRRQPLLPAWADGAALAAFVSTMIVFSALRPFMPDVFLNQAFYLPTVTFLVLALAEGRGKASRWLAGQRVLRFLGETSFALYLIHSPLLRRGFDLYYRLHEPMSLVPFAVLLTIVCVAAGCAVHLLIERPIQRIIRKLLDRCGLA